MSEVALIELLERWYSKAKESHHAHNEVAKKYSKFNKRLGLPLVAITTFTGTSVYLTMEESSNDIFQIVIVFLSVIAALLASFQTFLNYSEKSEKHRSVASRYGAIRREIEVILASNKVDEKNTDAIRQKLDQLSLDSPNIDPKTWDKISKSLS